MNKKKEDDLIELFVSEIKDLPKIEKETAFLLKKAEQPYKTSGEWKIDHQRLTELETTAKKILETLTPLTDIPVGVGDAFIVLRTAIRKIKEKLSENETLTEKDLSELDVSRRNYVTRVRNFSEDMEKNERRNLRRILGIVDENKELKKKILELQFDNEKLRRKLGTL